MTKSRPACSLRPMNFEKKKLKKFFAFDNNFRNANFYIFYLYQQKTQSVHFSFLIDFLFCNIFISSQEKKTLKSL